VQSAMSVVAKREHRGRPLGASTAAGTAPGATPPRPAHHTDGGRSVKRLAEHTVARQRNLDQTATQR